MTSTMTSNTKAYNIIRLTHVTRMTLRGLKEYARVEGVLARFGVDLESVSDLFLWNWSVRNNGVLGESSTYFRKASRRLNTGQEWDWHVPDAC
jgi:hypothetical protein